jgi:hypothetical protein
VSSGFPPGALLEDETPMQRLNFGSWREMRHTDRAQHDAQQSRERASNFLKDERTQRTDDRQLQTAACS